MNQAERKNIFGWGYNNNYQLGKLQGNYELKCFNQIRNMHLSIKAISLGEGHSVLLQKNGEVLGMGTNLFGQLGFNEKYKVIEFPSVIPIKETVVQVVCGGEHTLALTTSGNVYSWGLNLKGQLGHNTTENIFTPLKVEHLCAEHPLSIMGSNENVVQVAAGGLHSMVITNKKRLFTCGFNKQKQLCLGDIPQSHQFQEVKWMYDNRVGQGTQVSIRCGVGHSALFFDKSIYVWGTPVQGHSIVTPELHRQKSTIMDLKLGDRLSVALLKSGDVLVMQEKKNFEEVKGISYINEIKCGHSHVLAYSKQNDQVYGWGSNQQHQVHIYMPPEDIPQPVPLNFLKRMHIFEAGSLSNIGIIDYDFEPSKQKSPLEEAEEKFKQDLEQKEEESKQLQKEIQFQMDNIKQIKYQRDQEQNQSYEQMRELQDKYNKQDQQVQRLVQTLEMVQGENQQLAQEVEQKTRTIQDHQIKDRMRQDERQQEIEQQRIKEEQLIKQQHQQQQQILQQQKSKMVSRQTQTANSEIRQIDDNILQTQKPGKLKNNQKGTKGMSLSQIEAREVPVSLEIDFKELKLIKQISEGGYGIIYIGKWKELTVAVKVLKKEAINDYSIRDFLTECKVMQAIRHPHICNFLGACTKKPNYALVLEFCKRGSLWNIIQNRDLHLSWDERVRFSLEIAKGCFYLHSFNPPILHRDLKSLNVLVDEFFTVKLADFGWTKQLDEFMTGKIGTYQWMAPEVIAGQPYTEKADVFSYGIILWEISAREPPFRHINGLQVSIEVLNNDLRPKIPEKTPSQFRELIQVCWDRDPLKRPSFKKIIQVLSSIQY